MASVFSKVMAANRVRRRIALTVIGALLITACSGDDATAPSSGATTTTGGPATAPSRPPVVTVGGVDIAGLSSERRLGVRLSEGTAEVAADDSIEVLDGTPLSADEIAAITGRLPQWEIPASDVTTFNFPPQTLKPPLIGATVDVPFPPAADVGQPTVPADLPLEVVRYQPEGQVDIAPFLTVTFNQPMVPLATLDQLDAADVPVQIDPPIEGRWRWIGTRTLRFEVVPGATDRLPAATQYRIEVPAGTRSASGAQLAKAVNWSFSTPAPVVGTLYPLATEAQNSSIPTEQVFVAVFDQRVDDAAVLTTTVLRAGDTEMALRQATGAEIDADDAARNLVASALDGRAVAFRAVESLPVDTPITVTVGPGTPSAEGPLTSTGPATFVGRTYGSLRIVRSECGYGGGCVPSTPFTIEFSNPLDTTAFEASLVSVDPAIPGLRVDVYGNVISISGATKGRTTYRVAFAAALADTFGQTLGEPVTVDFEVGSAKPALEGLASDWITTDPLAGNPTVSVRTINHDDVRVIAWAVTPADAKAFADYLQQSWQNTTPDEPAWTRVLDEVVAVEAVTDAYVETAIDLKAAFEQAGSQLVVRIEPTETYAPDSESYWMNRPTVSWVQRTTLGVDAFVDNDELLIWTTDLRTGDPVGDIPVELVGDGRVATTDGDGLARVAVTGTEITGLWANAGDRTAFLPASWYGGWRTSPVRDEARFYVFDDRGIYKPGETVRVAGWVRRLAWSDDARLALYEPGVELTYRAWDPQGVDIATGTVPLNALGGFNLTFDVPAGANLGAAYVEFQLAGLPADSFGGWSHTFQIQEFRRPEFEVRARPESPAPYYAAAGATVAVDATYYAGGPLPDADVEWLVTTTETTYHPPNWGDFTFGVWQPWWYAGPLFAEAFDSRGIASPCLDCPGGASTSEQYSGRTDGNGTHYLRIDFQPGDGDQAVDQPTAVTAEATVHDVNRQAWASRTDLLVHPAAYYVGLRSDRTFVESGTPIRYDAVVTDIDGNLVPGRSVEVTAGRVEYGYVDGAWGEQLVDVQTCQVTSSDDAAAIDAGTAMRCEFTTEVGGTYRLTAIVADDAGHRNRAESTMWVSGGERQPVRNVEQQQVTIVPDRETYAPGDTAHLLVQAPFAPAHGIVTVSHGGIVSAEPFAAPDGSAVVDVSIDDASVPNVVVQIDLVGSAPRTADDGTPVPGAPARPAYATSQISLSVPPASRSLTVTATPAEPTVEPGVDTSVTVTVASGDGSPVAGADVTVIVIDEAVLALTGYDLADPLSVFYSDIWSNLQTRYSRSSILLSRADGLTGADGQFAGGDAAPAATEAPAAASTGAAPTDESARSSAGGAADKATNPGDAQPIDLRTDFSALAAYATGQTTAADGSVTLDVALPDNLTRYRVMAVAADGADRFGKGESTITARLPLMARPSAPRFLNFGDRFELPVVVQNQTESAIQVDVIAEVANLTLDAAERPAGATSNAIGKRVTVPANDRVEVRFPAAAEQVGTARYRVAAVATIDGVEASDAASGELPVYTPATTEAFATYGVIDDSTEGGAIGQQLLPPTGVFPEFGGLEIGTSSTALQALTDAVIYLDSYPYETPSGYASRIMSIATLSDVLDAFDAEGLPAPDALKATIDRDVAALAALQNDDGGWSWWARGLESSPWQTLEVLHALLLASEAGHEVPGGMLDKALAYAADIQAHLPTDYPVDARNTIRAYAVYLRNIGGDRDVAEATAVYRDGAIGLQLEAIAWLWPSIDDREIRAAIETLFLNAAIDTAGAATFVTDYSEGAWVVAHSDRRSDAVILDALITQTPTSDLIPKVVSGLLAHATRGRWNSAQDNAYVLVAMKHYFDTFEAAAPDFVARAWLGSDYVGEHEYRRRTTDRDTTLVPMNLLTALPSDPPTDIVVQRDGTGRLYYRLGLRYAPSDLLLDPRDEGFVVDRVYEAIDDPGDVTRDPDGTWHIRAGAKVRVRLTMVADARRTHVALVDPLPAGLEPINPGLAVSQTIVPSTDTAVAENGPSRIWCWCWNWFEHQNLRDDRAEAFASYLDGGTYEYTYVARATTPGEFVAPPARAEELYSPEVFGRSASAAVIVV
jgi:uncharacterized protein YfaS (alpha-2-macroglobulin family)